MNEKKLILRTIKYNQQAANNLPAYRRKVIALFHLGFALTLFFCIPFLLLLIFSIERCTQHLLLGSVLMIASLFILGRIIRPLLTVIATNDHPESTPLDPQKSPELFDMARSIASKLGLNNKININLHKHLAISGSSDKKGTTLYIGLPLMQTLTRSQFESVLTNQLIHIHNGNERLKNTMNLRIKRWVNLRDNLEGCFLGTLSAPFFKHTLPWLDLHTYPLYCHSILHSDTETTRLCPPETFATALCNLHTAASYLESDFWEQLTEQSRHIKRPRQMPFDAYPACLKPSALQSHLDNALNIPGYVHNTSPTLQQRLKNLNMPAKISFPEPEKAASALLGDVMQLLMQQRFNREWWLGQTKENWQKAYEAHQTDKENLAELDRLAGQQTLDKPAALMRAFLTESVNGDTEAALQQLAAIYRMHPSCPETCLHYGRMLLDKHDGDGVALVRRAAALDSTLALEAATLERDYHQRHGRTEAADHCQTEIDRLELVAREAQAERTYCRPDDPVQPACVAPETLSNLQAYLDTVEELGEVYLVEKTVAQPTDTPLYIIAFTTKHRWCKSETAAAERITARLTHAPFPHEAFIIPLNQEFTLMKPRLQKIENARIR